MDPQAAQPWIIDENQIESHKLTNTQSLFEDTGTQR